MLDRILIRLRIVMRMKRGLRSPSLKNHWMVELTSMLMLHLTGTSRKRSLRRRERRESERTRALRTRAAVLRNLLLPVRVIQVGHQHPRRVDERQEREKGERGKVDASLVKVNTLGLILRRIHLQSVLFIQEGVNPPKCDY